MSLVVNHNMMAMNAARNLATIYDRLSSSTQRLSSGLRINSAADDAAGLAIRELMRADIAVMGQGIRNAYDGISMIQTAEGAMAVIDEKLTRMKELAEQAATGTYTTVQRDIMNSEYQAMAREIDRIANATEFNGTKLLDGSISTIHGGSGMKIHFGTGNDPNEDYYFVTIGDVRATTTTGLQIGGDGKNDIWGQGAGGGAGSCCAPGPTSLDQAFFTTSGGFAYSYNYNFTEPDDADLASPSYLAGYYEVGSGSSLQDLIHEVNAGTQSRIRINFTGATGNTDDFQLGTSGALNICLGDEVFQFVSGGTPVGVTNEATVFVGIDGAAGGGDASYLLASAINGTSNSDYWAVANTTDNQVFVFRKDGGDNDALHGCDLAYDEGSALGASGATAASVVTWTNTETWETDSAGTTFGLGGESWATMFGVNNGGTWGVTLNGADVGEDYDITIVDFLSATGNVYISGEAYLEGFAPDQWDEIQNAADGQWVGAHIRTQSHAQEALAALEDSILKKDIIRANLGAIQNRLENTITNLSIQAENLQASESRISDIDMAKEMTEFTRNNILAQAAVSMLSQANSLPQLALSLLG